MQKSIEALIMILLIVGVVLGIYWLLWHLWLWVLPQIWPAGPAVFINPGYWLFSGAWFLFMMLGKGLFGGSKS